MALTRRYAEYRRAGRLRRAVRVLRTGSPERAGTSPVRDRPERDVIDLLQESARTERYWVLLPEPDRTWTLRQLDDTTGKLGEAEHTSDPLGDDPDAALTWARSRVDVVRWEGGWDGMSPRFPGAYIALSYKLVRSIGRTRRDGRGIVVRIETEPTYLPDVTLIVIREYWHSTGLVGDPPCYCEYSGFADDAEMLRQVSTWYGLDPDGWTTVTPGAEWRQ